MMDLQTWKQRRKELEQEVRRNRLAKALRSSRKRRGVGRASLLRWELERIAGRLRKLLRASRNGG